MPSEFYDKGWRIGAACATANLKTIRRIYQSAGDRSGIVAIASLAAKRIRVILAADPKGWPMAWEKWQEGFLDGFMDRAEEFR